MSHKYTIFYRHDFSSVLWLTIILTLSIWMAVGDSILLTKKQLEKVTKQYGEQAGKRMLSWQKLIQQHRNSTVSVQLESVNRFFNKLTFKNDQKVWGRRDYWATPVEFLGRGAGDCEDFSIAKYFTLRELNVPDKNLRLTYVKAKRLNQAHMVVSYYPKPNAEPLILDNLDKKIKKAGLRKDLIPAYSFNGEKLWEARSLSGYGTVVGSSTDIGIWQQLLTRIKNKINK